MHESHRCRNQRDRCPDRYKYEKYTGSQVRQCLYATIETFQDGYIQCPILEERGCEWCYEEFEKDDNEFEFIASQNYNRYPDRHTEYVRRDDTNV